MKPSKSNPKTPSITRSNKPSHSVKPSKTNSATLSVI
jgi:hypothetical protein